jgi:hypothetical protein
MYATCITLAILAVVSGVGASLAVFFQLEDSHSEPGRRR